MDVPPLCLFELRFRVLSPIRKLPHYHGAQWSALFRHAFRECLPEGQSMAQAGISCIPIETGIETYEAGAPAHVGLIFPAPLFQAICRGLSGMNRVASGDGHFLAGKTVFLESVYDRIADQAYTLERLTELSDTTTAPSLKEDHLLPEVERLGTLSQFRLVFYTPLRLNRPEGCKTSHHVFCDEGFFSTPPADNAPLDHLLANAGRIRGGAPQPDGIQAGNLALADQALLWLDIPYRSRPENMFHEKTLSATTLGGIVGTLTLSGTPAPDAARKLVVGQYTGVGKNHAFGLGFYSIPELDDVRRIRPLRRGKSILQRALTPETLKTLLDKATATSPGPDGLMFSDIKKAGRHYLENLCASACSGGYQAGGYKSYQMPKSSGGFREIHIQNAVDRLLQKAVADGMTPIIDNLLSKSSFAYRLGLNRQGAASALKKYLAEGYTTGVKADIAAFFDSVPLNRLADLLHGLFPFEPFVDVIIPWLTAACAEGRAALPQGSPLSPVLSNLYLHRFDCDMSKAGFKLIRYADDFVCLFQNGANTDQDINVIQKSLAVLGLALKPEKTVPLRPGAPVDFLGYAVTAEAITEKSPEENDTDQTWLPVFRETWQTGTPIYLSSICRGAYSSGAYLVIKDDRDVTHAVAWNSISRMIIVGRSPFSGGVVYRAARENIPVSFVDVRGRLTGSLYPAGYEVPEMTALQETCSADPAFCLDFARRIIAAKINNAHVLLRRNKTDLPELKEMVDRALQADNLETLRGYEGYAARQFFGALGGLVTPFEFKGRVYHPPDGPVNVMLSFGYTLLYARIALVLKDKGFNPRIGFFHQGRGSHLSLASDLLEELRHIAERIVLALIHTGEIQEKDFTAVNKASLSYSRLEGDGFRKFIHRYEHTMAQSFTTGDGEKLTYNAYLDEMADHLKRSLKMGIPYKALRID